MHTRGADSLDVCIRCFGATLKKATLMRCLYSPAVESCLDLYLSLPSRLQPNRFSLLLTSVCLSVSFTPTRTPTLADCGAWRER